MNLTKKQKDYLMQTLDEKIWQTIKEIEAFFQDTKNNGYHQLLAFRKIKFKEIDIALRLIIKTYLEPHKGNIKTPLSLPDSQIELYNIIDNKINYVNKEDIPCGSIIRVVKDNEFYYANNKAGFIITNIILKYIKELFFD